MLRKRKLILLIIFVLISIFVVKEYKNAKLPTIHSSSAVLIDFDSGDILYEKNAETAFPIASMSKLMTIYIVLEQIENGSLNWNELVTVSSSANDLMKSAAKIPINDNTKLTVHDLFQAMVISSANNATIALAEYIAGTESDFTRLMNKKAVDLGLSNQTNFVNTTGLSSADLENKMSAQDVAKLAQQLLKDYPDILTVTDLEHDFLPTFGIDLHNTNKMLHKQNNELYFEGVDGLKTGYTEGAGFCFVGTAEKGEQRLISVIINANTDEQRFIETKQLLSYGFSPFTLY